MAAPTWMLALRLVLTAWRSPVVPLAQGDVLLELLHKLLRKWMSLDKMLAPVKSFLLEWLLSRDDVDVNATLVRTFDRLSESRGTDTGDVSACHTVGAHEHGSGDASAGAGVSHPHPRREWRLVR